MNEQPITQEDFKQGVTPIDISQFQKQYDVKKHDIFQDKHKYPDQCVLIPITDEEGNPMLDANGKERFRKSYRALNRVGLPYQKRIVDIATMFQTAIPYKYTAEDSPLFTAFQEVIKSNKMSFSDSKICTEVKRYTQVAELWYPEEEENEKYGVPSKFLLRHKILSPEKYKLYPRFDDNNNLISFAVESTTKEGEIVFQAFTAEFIYTFTTKNGQTTTKVEPNIIGKIPVVLYQQEKPEWDAVQHLIEIAEVQRTYFSESNRKFGEPILMIAGKVEGKMSGGNTGGKVFEVKDGGNVQFVVPPNANESFDKEMSMNRRDIHEFSHTPDLSDEFYAGKGNMLSGVGRKLAWLPAHLKVKDNEAIFIPALQRRINIILAFLSKMYLPFEKELKDIDITPIITPFDIDDDTEMIRTLMEANGGKPLLSQREAMQRFGITDPEAQLQQIKDEENNNLNEAAI
ncbi:phage portal protein [Capnocytophaga leadbetteri]|uniref:phage portal protein n=1 Tax=Capnocytophaga leadbetteri TaxID=327575 RepID=UPI0028ED8413|nr:phage portal protein [Capnocytophaga leadbetteri]